MTNPNDPSHPSPFDDSGFPFRDVGLFCDNECGTPDLTADIRADTREQAFQGLRRLAAGQGWSVTGQEPRPALDLCPPCTALETS